MIGFYPTSPFGINFMTFIIIITLTYHCKILLMSIKIYKIVKLFNWLYFPDVTAYFSVHLGWPGSHGRYVFIFGVLVTLKTLRSRGWVEGVASRG